jgi:hypothetical protein
MAKTAYLYNCHCCKMEKATFETQEEASAAGWIQISVDGMIDRHWNDYDFCKSCSTMIAAAVTRNLKYEKSK